MSHTNYRSPAGLKESIPAHEKNGLAKRLSEDRRGIVRDQYCTLFSQLANTSKRALLQPSSKDIFTVHQQIIEASKVATEIVDQYWKQQR